MHNEVFFKKYKKTKMKFTKILDQYSFAIPFYIDQSYKEINVFIKHLQKYL